MSVTGAIRRNLYWMTDKLTNNGSVFNQYQDIFSIIKSPVLGLTKVERYKQELMDYAIKKTDYYHQYAGMKFEELPIVNKNDYIDNFQQFCSKDYIDKEVHRQYTNGSTGTPFTSIQNKEKRDRVIAELKVFSTICGVKSHERIVYLEALADRRVYKSPITQFKQNIWRIDTSDLGAVNMHKMCTYIKRKKGKLLFSYASTLDWLSMYLYEHPEEQKGFDLKVVIALGEALNGNTRRNCERYMGKNCKVISRYSNQEMGILAQEKGKKNEFLLNTGSYFFECLKLDGDQPAEKGEIGRIVITDLFNKAFPMLRYDTGDTGVIEYRDQKWPILKKLYGKKKDVLFSVQGVPISPISIASNFIGHNEIKQWQLIQEDEAEYVLHINCHEINRNTLSKVINGLKKLLGEQANIKVVYQDEIPELKAGKRRYTVCNIKKEQEV